MWTQHLRSCDISQIEDTDFTSSRVSTSLLKKSVVTRNLKRVFDLQSLSSRIHTFQELHKPYMRESDQLTLDATLDNERTIHVTAGTGATLTNANVIAELRAKDERKRQKELDCQAAQLC